MKVGALGAAGLILNPLEVFGAKPKDPGTAAVLYFGGKEVEYRTPGMDGQISDMIRLRLKGEADVRFNKHPDKKNRINRWFDKPLHIGKIKIQAEVPEDKAVCIWSYISAEPETDKERVQCIRDNHSDILPFGTTIKGQRLKGQSQRLTLHSLGSNLTHNLHSRGNTFGVIGSLEIVSGAGRMALSYACFTKLTPGQEIDIQLDPYIGSSELVYGYSVGAFPVDAELLK